MELVVGPALVDVVVGELVEPAVVQVVGAAVVEVVGVVGEGDPFHN